MEFFTSTAFLVAVIAFVVTFVIWYLTRKGILSNTVFGLTKTIFEFVEKQIPDDTEDKKWKVTDEVLKKVVLEMSETDGVLSASDIADLIKKYITQEIKK